MSQLPSRGPILHADPELTAMTHRCVVAAIPNLPVLAIASALRFLRVVI